MERAIPDEVILDSYADFRLTNHRLVYATRDGASAEVFVSVPLEQVQWTMVARSEKSWLLALTTLLIASSGLGAYLRVTYTALAFGVAALACFVAFWLTRRAVVSIGAGSVTCDSPLEEGDDDAEAAFAFLRIVDGHVIRAKRAKTWSVPAPNLMAA